MHPEKKYVEPHTDESIPRAPWPRLVYYLNQFALTKHHYEKTDEEAALDLLKQGESIQIPRSIKKNGETVPYSIWPTQACDIIRACVDFIYWKADKNPIPSAEELPSVKGAIILAEHLFPHAVSTPDGRFHLHYLSPKKDIVPYAHTQRIKSLAGQLHKYRETLLSLGERIQLPLSLPPLSCLTLVEEEIKSSKRKFETLLSQGFEGSINDSIDSLDALQENKGFLPTHTLFESPEGEVEEPLQTETESEGPSPTESPTLHPNAPTTLPWDNPFLTPTSNPRETQRGNISSLPENWLWNYEQDPLEYTLEYVCQHTSEAITQALELLQNQKENPDSIEKIGTKALIVNPKNKVNPDGFWRYLKSLTSGFPPEDPEQTQTLEKLDCARFSLSLEKLNKDWGKIHHQLEVRKALFTTPPKDPPTHNPRIPTTPQEFENLLAEHPWQKTWADTKSLPSTQELLQIASEGGATLQNLLHTELQKRQLIPPLPEQSLNNEEFLRKFYSKLATLLSEPWHTTKLRNELLLETFLEVPKPDGTAWTKRESEIWLEHLQTQAVGTYENSPGTEAERKKLLALLNSVYTAAEAEPEKAPHILTKLSQNLYSKLSGPISQVVRRELRTKLTQLKKACEGRLEKSQANSLQTMVGFISSISSQIKTGEWYEKKDENIQKLQEILTCVLHEPKLNALFFPGSEKPEAKEPLPISLDFLKTYSEEKSKPIGNYTIQHEIETARSHQDLQEGQRIRQALDQVSKNLDLCQGAERKLLHRKKVLQSTLQITQIIHSSPNPLETMDELCTSALEIVKSASNPPLKNTPLSSEKIEAWEIDTILENLDHIQTSLNRTNQAKKQNPRVFSEANYQHQLSLQLLAHAQFRDGKQEKKFLHSLQKLEKEIATTWENNYLFWKGISTIAWNIKTRREHTKFQASPSGEATLKNILAITKAKSENRTAGLNETSENPTQSRMFQIKTSRARKLPWEVTTPITLWLAEKTKGGKTKITQKEFEELLERRIQSCEVLLSLTKNDKDLGHKLEQFQGSQQEIQTNINQKILQHCLLFTQDPNELSQAIRWTQKNREKTLKLQQKNPHLDTPQRLFAHEHPEKSETGKRKPLARQQKTPASDAPRHKEPLWELDSDLSQEIPL